MPNEADAVLGVDPGSHRTGFAVVLPGPGRLSLVCCGVIAPPAGLDLARRLVAIHQGLTEIISQHRPAEMAVEGVFAHKNPRSALALGQARGVALLAGAQAGLVVHEYPPTVVKKALVGTGRATKEQVRAMVGGILGQTLKVSLDASDAAALALCHLQTRRLGNLLARLRA